MFSRVKEFSLDDFPNETNVDHHIGTASQDDYRTLAQALFHEFGVMHRRMTSRISNAVSGEMAVMRALRLAGGTLTPTQIADKAWVSAPRVANILRSLETKGWIARTNDPTDRRRVLVNLTDKGKDLLDAKRAHFDESTAHFLAQLGYDDAQELLRLLRRMNQVVDANQEKLPDPILPDNEKEA